MLGFRNVCPQHRELFIATLQREGCRDPDAMEQVRRRLMVWLSETYPRLVLDNSNAKSCLGCGLAASCVDLGDMYAIIRDLAHEVVEAA